ncbi:hypothetical protein [Oribacterium sp. NK2B42]|uniref:hypothetical protein n=1 Tax=Oribacterium sp. NK2B42 TaxID=689781 RepID=UPI00067774C8|nr:hypothetical protein [Oribacterium sp. NK2B42]
METKLARIAELSAQNPKMVFTSIGHLIDVNFLRDFHMMMDGEKAVGIDGITKEDYGRNLDANLVDFTDLYALCFAMVVQGENTAEVERIQRYHSLC